MLGCNNGVQAKLKSTVPHLLEFHCVAHREALSVSQAYQCIDYFVQLESTLRAIYSFFAHSSVRLERLKLVFNIQWCRGSTNLFTEISTVIFYAA